MKAWLACTSNCKMFLLNCGESEVEIQAGMGRVKISLATTDELFECVWPFCGNDS